MKPEELVAALAELERLRESILDRVEQQAPQLRPEPPAESGADRTSYELLLGLRRAVLGSPAAARHVHDILVAQGHRYAETPEGAQLRDALASSEAVENLRVVWETVSLNVLDGPARPGCPPDAWATLFADTVVADGLDDAVLSRFRPEGFA